MNTLKSAEHRVRRILLPVVALAAMTTPLMAQDSTTSSVRHHTPSYSTEVRNAKVVYVEGNDLVLKLEDGKIEHLIVPDSDRFTIDGKSVSVSELMPGTTLTQTITTVATPRYVNSVRVLKGKVWHVTRPNHVILSLPDGTHRSYTIPKHAKITIDGKPGTAFDLKRGHALQATIVTDQPEAVVTRSKEVVGQAPAPALPPVVGVLLFQTAPKAEAVALDTESTPEPVTVASSEPLPTELPKTASPLPALSLFGFLAIAGSLGFGIARKKTAN